MLGRILTHLVVAFKIFLVELLLLISLIVMFLLAEIIIMKHLILGQGWATFSGRLAKIG